MTKTPTPAPLTDARSKTGFFWLVCFALISVLHLLAESLGWSQFLYFTKPSLMWWLLFFVWQQTARSPHSAKWPLITALLASNAGDIFLLFAGNDERFFILGLSSFLIAHLAYIVSFYRLSDRTFQRPAWPLLTFLAAFWLSFNAGMWSGMPGPLKPPVIVYSLVILTMAAFAWHLSRKAVSPAGQMVWWGAVLFVISDTFIGLNKFGQDLLVIPGVRMLIMLTYLLGQLGIVYGTIQLMKPREVEQS